MLDLNFFRNNLELVQRKVEANRMPFDRELFWGTGGERPGRGACKAKNGKKALPYTGAAFAAVGPNGPEIMENFQNPKGKIKISGVLKIHFNGRNYF